MSQWTVGLVMTCQIREESATEFKQLVRDFVSSPPKHCVSREAFVKVGEPECYQLLERWSNARHLDAHLDSNAHRALLGGIRTLGALERTETIHFSGVALQDAAPSLANLVIHDLRNPLAAVMAHVALVRDDLAAACGFESQVEDLRSAGAACEHLEGMISDLLVLTRLGARHLHAARAATGVHEIVGAVARSFAAVATARGIAIDTVSEPVVARVDAALVRRLLENLVSNAIRHARSGDCILLLVRTEGEAVRLAVRNTGPPVADAVLATLDRGPAGARARARHGLGLYLCQLVAKAHGGRFGHVPRPGWNVSFEATLAIADPARRIR